MDDAGDAYPHFRHAEFGVMRRNPEIAGGGKFEPAAEAPAGHPGDDGSRKRPYGLAGIAETRDEFFSRGRIKPDHLLDVGATDHGLFALTGDHQHADLPVSRQRLQSLAYRVERGRSHDIERAGIADRETDHAARVAVDAAKRV